MAFYRSTVLVSVDPACVEKGAYELIDALNDELIKQGLIDEVRILETPRLGDPQKFGPDIIVYPEGTHYTNLTYYDVPRLVEEHFIKGRILKQYAAVMQDAIDEEISAPKAKEIRIVLRNVGVIDPRNIEDYIANDGYQALGKVLTEMSPEDVIQEILDAKLRGRGGAGFPTGLKWRFARQAEGDIKYIVCNADEGDPGAFMNRRVLEGDPHSVVEGMIIAAYAIGARQGYIYCRAEYPIAVSTVNLAMKQARALGLLGKNIMGTDFSFDLEMRMGAGAFVCGEETALMASIEGGRGEPRVRPPFPAQKGLWGKPTNINNVETYANVPQIILNGAEWYASMGTEKSKGTKTFALAGDVKNTGLIEVPFGITLREIIYDVGNGIKGDKKFKAVQTGGPMGGCIPVSMIDLPVDYETLGQAGSIMGSGGMIVMDEDTCMVDIARFFIEFIQEESCGKCVPCRVGTRRLLEILEGICEGRGKEGDIETLRSLCAEIKENSLCGLGQGAPAPVVSTLNHFLDEYEAHIKEKRCPAKVCRALIKYQIVEGACTGCTVCARNCPVAAITGERKQLHVIDQDLCIKCGICHQVCAFDAINVI
ncbi:MAG TPA: NADH-quinone oxidoreductase subunit NuoF [Anaerolineaceae bacterium]|nr:NADH-quinone oxidoreductase subunit NuoF [Anaerolineales bacterium]HPY32803.1 NADH-quinone oxidoreductase subunit NuoF [Anaerolineaceae bacterium]HQC20384.1 NADH-quinone oxidoreductase subunit NuoF [Anaerolineaceae bacterium]HQK42460.1 NADH-quinone oxidoreductase subunit NuoF [Anaerolineaceae bacterium]